MTKLLFLLLSIVPVLLHAQFKYQEIISIPWGNAPGQVGLRSGPEGLYGPRSFSVQNDTIIILDTENQRMMLFRQKLPLKYLPVQSQFCDDIAWISEQHYFTLQNNRVDEYSSANRINTFSPATGRDIITCINITGQQISTVINGHYSSVPVDGQLAKPMTRPAIQDNSGQYFAIERSSPDRITLLRNNIHLASISSDTDPFGVTRYIGSSPGGNIYIYLEYIRQQIPLQVSSYIEVYSGSGDRVTRIELPQIRHTAVFREFFVDKQGNIYHMISAPDGIHIIGWLVQDGIEYTVPLNTYPEKFSPIHHYNFLDHSGSEPVETDQIAGLPLITTAVNRDEALAIGDSYVQHQWTAEQKNLTPGRILDPAGVEIQTPSWIKIGQNTKIPYKWGGFWTLAQFDQGMSDGKYAGDIATSGVSGYCSGVDCSGFLSRCWKLPTHYSTRMMDDNITIAYDSWAQLQQGDAIHIVGHVRMFVGYNNDGSLLVVESSGRDWRVAYHSYTYADLTNYTPRYYINMQGSPNMLPRPITQAITISDSIQITWNLSSDESSGGYNIYTSRDGQSWEYALVDLPVAAEINKLKMPLESGLPVYYKIVALSAENPDQGSYPSDIYGYKYNPGTPRILIVDGFDRTDGSFNASFHDFAMRLGIAIGKNPVSFESCDNDALLSGQISLTGYDAVFWLLGDESVTAETFNSSEQEIVKSYLQQGGNLFVSGSEVGWDLDSKGSTADAAFFHDYFCTRFQQDDSRSYKVNGSAGTVFEGLTINFDDGTHGVYEEDYPDAFLAHNGSEAVLYYENGLIAATGVQKVFPEGSATASVILAGFPYETIYEASERDELIKRVLQYFGLIETNVRTDNPLSPADFELLANYPNPFNPQTTFEFFLPAAGKVNLTVYNLLGQRVADVLDIEMAAGRHIIGFNARDLASGTYVYTLRWKNQVLRGKMQLVK